MEFMLIYIQSLFLYHSKNINAYFLCLIVGGSDLAGAGYFSRLSESGGVIIKWPTGKIATTLKEVEELMMSSDGLVKCG